MSDFVLKQHDHFDWPVKVQVPRAGKRELVKFHARFNLIDAETADELLASEETQDPIEFLRKSLVKYWDLTVHDEDGEPVEDDEERNRIIISNPIFANGLIKAYGEGSLGKNLKN